MERAYDQELLEFIQNSPTVYHVIAGQKQRLLEAGYRQLLEGEAWDLRPGGRYFSPGMLRHPGLPGAGGGLPGIYDYGQPQ